jgi:AraC family transcriptional regulator
MSLRLGSGCFYGTVSNSFKAAEVMLAEIAYPSDHKTPEHSHDHAYLSLTLKGTYTKLYGGRRVECAPQTLVFHPPFQKQSGYCGQAGGRSFLIQIEPALLDRLCCRPLIPHRLAIFREGSLVSFAARLYREFRSRDEFSPLVIEGLLLEILAQASRRLAEALPATFDGSRAAPRRWLEQTKEILHARFSEPVNLRAIAETVGVHPVYLASEFRRKYRVTVGEYARNLRVDFARRQLASTETRLVEIALESGFANQSHFATTFKRVTGDDADRVSPTVPLTLISRKHLCFTKDKRESFG